MPSEMIHVNSGERAVAGKRSNNASARLRRNKRREPPLPFLIATLGWTRYDAVVFVVVILAIVAILVNGLFMQSGLASGTPIQPGGSGANCAACCATGTSDILAQGGRGPAPVAAARSPGEIVTDAQRELARAGITMALWTVSMARARTLQSRFRARRRPESNSCDYGRRFRPTT
jgi:hypothetical protein